MQNLIQILCYRFGLYHKQLTIFLIFIILLGNSDKILAQYQQTDELLELEKNIYRLVNQYRVIQELPPLALDTTITIAARMHSQAMAYRRVPFSHKGFNKRVQSISKFFILNVVAENIAYHRGCLDCANRAVQGWLESPPHRMTIEGKFRVTGIGVAGNSKFGYYFTQIFCQ